MITLHERGRFTEHNLKSSDVKFLKKRHEAHLDIHKNKLKATIYIGTIQCPSGEKIIIHPKISIKNVLYIISYTYDLVKFYDYNNPKEKTLYRSPIEIYIIVLLNWIEHIYKSGLLKTYQDKIEESTNLKGKILLNSKVLTHGKFYCFNEEITFSSLENRILKSTLNYILKNHISIDLQIKKRILNVLKILSNVETIRLSKKIFSSIQYHSLNKKYKRIIELCELIYKDTYLTSDDGNTAFSAYLINMQNVFQKFIFKLLEVNLPKEKIKYLERLYPIEGNDKYVYIPDIIIDGRLVVDTKYYLDAFYNYNKDYRIKNDDLDKMRTYCDEKKTDGLIIYAGKKLNFILAHNDTGIKYKEQPYKIFKSIFPIDSSTNEFSNHISQFIDKVKLFYSTA